MTITNLIEKLNAFKQLHGDVEIEATYYCVDCREEHKTDELDLILTSDNHLTLSPTPLGM